MPSIYLADSPFMDGGTSRVSVVQEGSGPALVFLHGGWGYDCYPVDVKAFSSTHTIIIPSRTGYGNSTPVTTFPPDFHRRAALETWAVLDGLHIERAALWGHSDGAVIAVWAALLAPDRVRALLLEAPHYFADKPHSRAFFEQMATEPDSFGPSVRRVMAGEHGPEAWRTIMQLDGQAWLDLADNATAPTTDVYGGQLPAVACPVLIIHGDRDPRSEPGELEALAAALPGAQVARYAESGHCPHWEAGGDDVTAAILEFLAGLEQENRQPLP